MPSQGGTFFSSTESRRANSAPDKKHGTCKQLSSYGLTLWSSSLPIQLPSLTVPSIYPLFPSLTSFFPPLSSPLLLSPFGLPGGGRKAADSDPVTEPAGWDLHGAWISFWSIQNSCPTHGFSLQCSG